MASSYDCIVVGAGMAGLTYATLAAQDGAKVLVLEQHYLPGGSFTAFKQGKYKFNVALEWTTDCGPGGEFGRLLAKLGVMDDYPFEKISIFKTVVSPQLSVPLELPCGRAALAEALVRAFPGEAGQIDRFLADCIAVASDPARGRAVMMKSGLKPVEAMLADYFADPLLADCLASVIAYPGARGVLLMYMIAALCLEEMYRPIHGDHRRLAALLHARLRKLGAHVRYEAVVTGIDVVDDAVRGVQLADGSRFSAPTVVAGVDPWQLYEGLLCGRYSHAEPARDLLRRKAGCSTFSVYLGLDAIPASMRRGEGAFAVLARSDAGSARSAPGDGAESLARIPLRVECQSLSRPGLAPTGRGTLVAWAVSPISAFDHWGQGRDCAIAEMDGGAYLAAKQQATAVVLDRLKEAFPDLGPHIELVEAATPFTFKRYTLNRAGSVSGYSLADLAYLKPAGSATPVRGLFHVGQWTVQSGVNLAMRSAARLHQSQPVQPNGLFADH